MTARCLPFAVLAALAVSTSARAESLAVIVHVDRDTTLTIDEVAQIYLKRRRFWDDGQPIVAVNRDSRSDTRKSFVEIVFGEDMRQLAVYWNRQYFQGILPPATLASDEAVKRFVASERKAIGYVRASAVDDSVRVVLDLRIAPTGP